MISHQFSSSLTIFFLFFFDLQIYFADAQEINIERFNNCSSVKFECNDQRDGIGYPFWGSDRHEYCGPPDYKLDCKNGRTQIEINSIDYRVLSFDGQNKIIRIASIDFLDDDDACPSEFSNTTRNTNLFSFPGQDLRLFYGCPTEISPPEGFAPYKFRCQRNSSGGSNRDDAYFLPPMLWMAQLVLPLLLAQCDRNVQVPMMDSDLVRLTSNATLFVPILKGGFELNYGSAEAANYTFCDGCFRSGGQCGFNSTMNQHICYRATPATRDPTNGEEEEEYLKLI